MLARLSLAVAVLAIAALPSAHSQSLGRISPYNAAVARLKTVHDRGIYHGQKTPKGAFPFVVALVHADNADDEEGNYQGQFCTGALVADRFVLTAAQCVVTEDDDKRKIAVMPDSVAVYVGSNDFKGGKRIKVKRVLLHSKFEADSFNNDIALLELAASARSNKTATIALATRQNEGAIAGVGKKVTAAGWGETEGKELPQALRHVEMDVLDSATCNANILKLRKADALESWAKLTQIQFALPTEIAQRLRAMVEKNAGKVVNDNMICSGRPRTKRDTCSGDNGGPLFAKGAGGKFVLVGITSWGEGCGLAEKGLYGIYTRVARYADWVREHAK
jgi:secreted trypsin-like serine protease